MIANPDIYREYGTGTHDTWFTRDSIEYLPENLAGSYIVLVYLAEQRVIQIGKLASTLFAKGYYAYVGSAMRGIKARLARHFAGQKNCHWHIDYLLGRADAIGALVLPEERKSECILAMILNSKFVSFHGFGSSDCRCGSHLFFDSDGQRMKDGVQAAVELLRGIYF